MFGESALSGELGLQLTPSTRGFRDFGIRETTTADSLAEQGEFELPVPSSEQPDDNIMSRSALLSRSVTVARGFNAWSAYRDEQNRVTGESTIGVGLEFERIPLCARIGRQTRAECHPNKC